MKHIMKLKHLWFLPFFVLASLILSACLAELSNNSLYRGNELRTGFFETEGVPTLTGVKWQFETGDQVWSSPVVAGGVVYFGSDDNHLYAVSVETGEELWRYKTGDDIRSSPAITHGVVYISSYDGFLHAVDAETGQEVWKFDTMTDSTLSDIPRPKWDDYTSSPLVDEGVVYIGGLDPLKCLFAIDAKTGEEIWHFKPKSADQVRSSPAIFDDLILFGGEFFSFYAIHRETGELIWKFETGGAVRYAPAVDKNGIVYFGSKDTNLYALDARSGDEKWRNNLSGLSWVSTAPAIGTDFIYAGTSDMVRLFAVDPETGETQWAFQTDGYVWSSPTAQAEIVYVGSGDGNLYAIDAHTGQELWYFETGKEIYATPVIDDGVVYITSLNGNLYALH